MRKNYPDVGEICRKLLPVLSKQKSNEYLKEMASVCGINKDITFHKATQFAQQLGVAL